MKRIILLFLMAVALTTSAYSARTAKHLKTHQTNKTGNNTEWDRSPIQLPIAVYYDSDTNILEVWCDDDNIQAEVYVYNESGELETYSPYMNITIQLPSSESHTIHIIGDGWEAEGELNI